jgi:hypothetical protein
VWAEPNQDFESQFELTRALLCLSVYLFVCFVRSGTVLFWRGEWTWRNEEIRGKGNRYGNGKRNRGEEKEEAKMWNILHDMLEEGV